MANLLQTNFSEHELASIIASCLPRNVLPPAGSAEWLAAEKNPAVQKWLVPIRDRAETEAAKPMPELSEEILREYQSSGLRVNFETVYFERRRQIGRAAICALVDPGHTRWHESLRRKIHELLSETSMGLPSVANPSAKEPAQIDALAAESANLLAELVGLFGEVLGEDMVATIKSRLHEDFFRNYILHHEKFGWTRSADNTNAVCHQGVIGAALLVEDDAILLARMLFQAKKYLSVYLGGFGKDGGCPEGPGYWQYGFGRFCVLNEQLETRTNGRLSLIEGDEKISAIARYGPSVALNNFHFANFSDSPQTGSIKPSLLHYLGERLDDDFFRIRAYAGYQHLHRTGLNFQTQRCDLFYLGRLFLHCPQDLSREVEVGYEDVYLPDTGIVVAHGQDTAGNFWDFAAKGGHNAEMHNHNDCGSYILNINGTRLIVEIGAPEYARDYFRERRYEHIAARTLGHSLPIVNDREQSGGPHFNSKILVVDMDGENLHMVVDLTHCYPHDSGASEVVRDFKWDKKQGCLTVRDYYELTRQESFVTAIITDKQVTITDDRAHLLSDAIDLVIRPLKNTQFAGQKEHSYRDHNGIPRRITRILLAPDDLEKQRSIGYEITLT
jgi:hypothetical protein